MPEYRRFVAYFYEYIDGKKQKNAGFAKVELRNGMWRVLFRLTMPNALKVPARVYGFVRENGYLLGLPLGNMSVNGQNAEEWAWRADVPVGFEQYYFGQLSGLWVENPDGRTFITVWDDEALNPGRFVLERPERETVIAAKSAERRADLSPMKEPESGTGETLSARSVSGADLSPVEASPEEPADEPEPGVSEVPSEKPMDKPKPGVSEVPSEKPMDEPEPGTVETPSEWPFGLPVETPEELPPERPDEMAIPAPDETSRPEPMAVPSEPDIEIPAGMEEKIPPTPAGKSCVEALLRSRQCFQPFTDEEISDCVQIRMCDLVSLQQEGWQVGRSNFLWHGYSQYRHLLLGRYRKGGYVLGVPGAFSRQEEYAAGVFGYGQFKISSLGGCGRRLGYWCRILNKPEQAVVPEYFRGAEQAVAPETFRGVEQVAVSEALSTREKAETRAFMHRKEREGSTWN